MKLNIQHDKDKHRFYVEIDGKISELKYKKIDDKTLEYYHTYVPEELRDQGIASFITQHALEYAKKQGYSIISSCPFVKQYLDDHPEFADVIKT